MLPGAAPAKVSWTPILATIGIGAFLGIASFVGLVSQWGRPTTSIATASFVGILLGILIFMAGCIWLLVKLLGVMSRSR